MTLTHATLGALLLFVMPVGYGGPGEGEPSARTYAQACTTEAQKCLDKLETRLRLHGRSPAGVGVEQALLELHETDPECALLLQGAGLFGL